MAGTQGPRKTDKFNSLLLLPSLLFFSRPTVLLQHPQVMSPSQASSEDFPRLTGASNFDVWKARVCASLDGKHLLGFVTKKDYNGISDDEEDLEDHGSDMSDIEPHGPHPAKSDEAVDDEEDNSVNSDDELKPYSDEEDDASSIKATNLPTILSFREHKAARSSGNHTRSSTPPPSARQLRRLEAKTKAFLMKTMDNTHIRLVKNLVTSYDIFTAICKKYEGAAFHGDPYFIQHFLMEIKFEEGTDLTDFFFKLENAMKAASEATESVFTDAQRSLYLFHAMPPSWKDDLRVWKGMRKYIPYEELKMSIEAKVREIQAQERYSLNRGTPESVETKREKALVAAPKETALPAAAPPQVETCSYCSRQRHTIRQCRKLQQDLRDGTVKDGTVLPANFVFHGGNRSTAQRHNPYGRPQSFSSGGRFSNRSRGGRFGGRFNNFRRGGGQRTEGRSHHGPSIGHTVLVAVMASTSAVSLAAQAPAQLDAVWTIDSGCTRHIAYHRDWFSNLGPHEGSILVGGKNTVPIEGVGHVTMTVVDSKGTTHSLTIPNVLYAPQLGFNLLSVPAAVKHDFGFTFKKTVCAVQTDQRFKINAAIAAHTDLYQFRAEPVITDTNPVATVADTTQSAPKTTGSS